MSEEQMIYGIGGVQREFEWITRIMPSSFHIHGSTERIRSPPILFRYPVRKPDKGTGVFRVGGPFRP